MYGRMKMVAVGLVAIGLAAAIATWSRYESFDPCVWMEQDLARDSNLPRLAIRARIQAEFLLRGIGNPGPYQCLQAWWKFRADNLPKGS